MRKCLASGQWMGEAPICKRKDNVGSFPGLPTVQFLITCSMGRPGNEAKDNVLKQRFCCEIANLSH